MWGLMEHVVMCNWIIALYMEIHVKMVAPVLALVLTVSTAGAQADTVGLCVKIVKLPFAILSRVKMEGPV